MLHQSCRDPRRRRPLRRVLSAALAVATIATPTVTLTPVAHAQLADPVHAFDNGRLRFGAGAPESSVDEVGNLRQPFYRSSSGTWNKLTFSSYPLDLAVGTGTGGTNWTGATVVENPEPTGQVIDASGFVTTSTVDGTAVGHGTLRATGTAEVSGADLEVRNTYELGAEASFVKVTTRLRNLEASAVGNAQLWVGTRDDFVGGSDRPTKERGNLEDGVFVPTTASATPAAALRITTGQDGVLFYSTTAGTDTSVAGCCAFRNAYGLDPATSPVTLTNDGSYALHLPVGELSAGETAEIVWYYAAGSLADLEDVVREVADAALSRPTVSIGNGRATVTWRQPVTEQPVTDYLVRWRPEGSSTWTEVRRGSVATPLSHVVEGLTNGVRYTFEVAAVTGTGGGEVVGPWSPTSDGVVPGVPTNETRPVVVGEAVVGETLTVEDPDAHWTNHATGDMTASYQWRADGHAIDGATGSSLVVTRDHVGAVLTVAARRTNPVGYGEAVSTATGVVPPAPLLTGLELSVGTLDPAFDPDVHRYAVVVPAETATVAVTPTAPVGAAITLVGEGIGSGDHREVPVPPGHTEVPVRVTVAGRSTDYVVTVVRHLPAPSPVPSPVPSPSAPAVVRDERGELPPAGGGHGTVGGAPVDLEVRPGAPGGVEVEGEGFRIEVSPQSGDAAPAPGAADLSLVQGRAAQAVVEGFAPSSTVRVWLFSQPTQLGTFTTDADGRMTALTSAIGADLPSCRHTLHLEGQLPGGRAVAVSLGAWVEASPYPFRDVRPRSAHARAIACLSDLDVLRGKGAGRYDDQGPLERGQTASVVTRLLGLPERPGSPATDTVGSAHAGAIAAAVERRILRGYADGTFRPADAVTRGQLASMLAAAAGLDTRGRAAFPDTVGSVHAGAIAALARQGVLDGFADGTFRPGAPVTRGQAASSFLRLRPLLVDAG